MASDLLSIARSGTQVARIGLDVTAQNIANAASEGYVRRSIALSEVAATGGIGRVGDVSLSGVRLDRVVRNADLFRQSEARRTGADASRAATEVTGLENVAAAVEQSNLYPAVVQFEASLQQLAADPVDSSRRAAVIEDARTMTRGFNIAATGLDAAGTGLRFEAADDVAQVNVLGGELARVNLRLARAADAAGDRAALLDQRDALLSQLSERVDVSTVVDSNGTVEVRVGGTTGPQLVSGGAASPLAMITAADGTLSFTLGGAAVTPLAGSLTGRAQALQKLADVRTRLDTLAAGLISTVNTVLTAGVARDGSPGQALFSGSGAATIGLAFQDGALLATASAGAAANSRDPANLDALRSALATNDPSGGLDSIIFEISSAVSGRTVTRDALTAIAGTARIASEAQSGVDLDAEAINLVRYQQAFQASGRVMQTASTLFDTLLGIR